MSIMKKENERERIISLNDLWDIFISRIVLILVVAAIVTGSFFAYKTITFVPEYKSKATLYILRQNESKNDTQVREDFSLALNVVNDCTFLLKSHAVLDEVIEELSLNIPYDILSSRVKTHNPENTRILEVSVSSGSPKEAKRIVDCLCRIGSKKIMEAMGFNQVNLFENGTLESKPSNITGIVTYALIAGITAAVMYAIFLIAFLIDDRIRTEEDIENYLGLSLLGDIPNAYGTAKSKYGYYGKSKKYGYGKAYTADDIDKRYGKELQHGKN